jgi:DNA-binding MarR family transcriptional regulator
MTSNEAKMKEMTSTIENGIEEFGRDNGVPIEAYTIYKTKKARLPDHVMLFQAFSMFAAGQFQPTTCKVLFKLLSLSEYENYISIDVKTIAEEISLSVVSVNRALKELKDSNVISVHKHTSDKRRNDYFINPLATWKGSSIQREKQIKKLKNDQKQLEFFS